LIGVALLLPRFCPDDSGDRVKKAVGAVESVQAGPGTAGGDKRDMRMVPIIGAGIASEVPGTRPDRAILRLDGRA
jgi:hypothetical protein